LRNWQVEGNVQSCLKKIPWTFNIEKNLLRGLARCGTKQLVQAMDSIPRQTRHLYLHSYQSFVWNRIASMRISKLGYKVVVGDLVRVKNNQEESNGNGEPTSKRIKLEENEENGDAPQKATKSPNDYVIKRVTSQEDCDKYQMTQVVLPVPGHDVIYPEYPTEGDETDNWYEKVVAGDGLKMTSFAHSNKCYSLCGDYRNLISKVSDLSYEFVNYTDYKIPLVLSDRDILENKKYDEQPQQNVDQTASVVEQTALVVKFQLNTSSYATVALRDICKVDLSAQHQSLLSDTRKHLDKK